MLELLILVLKFTLSYFVSRKAGASKGTAALIATGVTAASYYSGTSKSWAESVSGWLNGDESAANAALAAGTAGNPGTVRSGSVSALDGLLSSAITTAGSVAVSGIETAGDVAKNWGPSGTAIFGASSSIDWKKYAPFGIGLIALFIITR